MYVDIALIKYTVNHNMIIIYHSGTLPFVYRTWLDILGEDDNQLYVNYTPTRPGVYNIVVFYDNIQIDGSPFKVTVDVDG